MFHYQAQWWQSRLNGRCRGCNKQKPDPVSLMCVTCYKRYKRDGSPSIKRPQLKHEIKQAEAILERYDLEEAQTRFTGWMRSYARASQGTLNWLCREFFFDLKGCNGEPLMDLKQAIKQTLAVSLYNGVLDEKRQQHQYLYGRASTSLLGQRKEVKGGRYHLIDVMRRPRLFRQAFNDVFINGGIARLLAGIRKAEGLN
jgi:hypothetical protein